MNSGILTISRTATKLETTPAATNFILRDDPAPPTDQAMNGIA